MQGTPKSLKQLFFPICLETLCFILAGMVDTLMLSSLGDEAVGAVGTANITDLRETAVTWWSIKAR